MPLVEKISLFSLKIVGFTMLIIFIRLLIEIYTQNWQFKYE